MASYILTCKRKKAGYNTSIFQDFVVSNTGLTGNSNLKNSIATMGNTPNRLATQQYRISMAKKCTQISHAY